MSLEPLEYLRHMLAEADCLASATAGLTREQFLGDQTLRRAAVRSIEIIGEAAKIKRLNIFSTSATSGGTKSKWKRLARVSPLGRILASSHNEEPHRHSIPRTTSET